MSLSSYLPQRPSAMGFSRRLLLTLGVGVMTMVLLFFYFLNAYSPKRRHDNQFDSVSSMSAQSAEVVDALSHQPLVMKVEDAPVLSIEPAMPALQKTSVMIDPSLSEPFVEEKIQGLTSEQYQEAANAQLSVYHRTDSLLVNGNRKRLAPYLGRSPMAAPIMPNLGSMKKNEYAEQNQQKEKLAFVQHHRSGNHQLSSSLEPLRSPYTVGSGSIIPATLVTGIDSDLPGSLIARVRSNVYDSTTGNYLLIPQGSRLLGRYDSKISYVQSRLLIVWNRIIFPNGQSIDLETMQGVDLIGKAGLKDQVNNHYLRLYGSAILYSMIVAGSQIAQPAHDSHEVSPSSIIAESVAQQLSQVGIHLLAKNMNVQPTITIRPGANFNVMLTKDMVLPGPYHVHSSMLK